MKPLSQADLTELRTVLSDTRILKLLRTASEMGDHKPIDRRINDRARVLAAMRANTDDLGRAHIEVWQRDCDCAEFTTRAKIAPTLLAYEALRQETYLQAEGPWRLHVMTRAESAEWQATSRDRVLEAYENGSYYRV